MRTPPAPGPLARVVGVPGAVLLGLGSILGTGLFVGLGLAAGIAGAAMLPAVLLAAAVATCNGLSSAQLAAAHPVSGGTYEYGYRLLTPGLGFTAGWMFLCAKSASAATAALGLAGYLGSALGLAEGTRIPIALLVVAAVTTLVAGGMRRSNRANAAIVATTLLGLGALIVLGLPSAAAGAGERIGASLGLGDASPRAFLEASALLFVAYTGYGRVATLGEEIRDPARSIPRAVVLTLVATAALYLLVAFVALGVVGAERLAAETEATAAPLELVARELGVSWLPGLVLVAAGTAMLGVLLNLVLGLSRVLLAMARRGDAPGVFAGVHASTSSPRAAVLGIGGFVALLALLGDVGTTWSLSAVTVLVYYALTNLAALRQPGSERRYPRWIAALGLVGCLSLAPFVEREVALAALALLVLGLVGHLVARRRRAAGAETR